MKKHVSAIYVISSVATLIAFALLAIRLFSSNGQASFDELKYYFIPFLVFGAISGVTKRPAERNTEEVYYAVQALYEERQRQNWLNQEAARQQNQQMVDMQNQQMIDMQNQQAMEQAAQAAENARLAATGIEFGGYNPDPNLNPGMQSTLQDFGSNNSMGMF